MRQTRWPEQAVRVALLLAGLAVAHLGVTLFLESDLGSDPFNVLVQGLYRALPWPGWMTHGRVHLLVCLLIVLVLLAAARNYVRIGTLLCMALGGPIIDLWTVPLAPLFPDALALPWRLLTLVTGCVILAFGMTVVIRSEAGTGPNDLVAVVLSDRTGKPFGPVRVAVDVLFALSGWRWTFSLPCPAGCWGAWRDWAPWCAPPWWVLAPRFFSLSAEGCAISA